MAVFSGIFMYSNTIAIVPFIEALVLKGLHIGTALSFMMAVVALSLPEFMMLKKIISFKLLFIFILIVGFGIITLGISFNLIFKGFNEDRDFRNGVFEVQDFRTKYKRSSRKKW